MSKSEIVLIPTPGIGHLVSSIEFAKLIVKNDLRISILVLVFHLPNHNSTTVDAYIESQCREVDPNRVAFLTLPPPSNPPDPASCPIELQKPLVKKAIEGRTTKPAAFVLDFMCVNFIDIAKEIQVPSYVYSTVGASLLSLMFYLQERLDEKGVDIATELNYSTDDVGLDLPGFRNPVPAKALPMMLFEKDRSCSKFFDGVTRKLREANGILANTFMELEPSVIQSLHNKEKIPSVFPVGPILALEENSRGGPKEDNRASIMRWLDEQPCSSVVFLCFGSMGSFDEEQVKEIANGLDRSEHRFLWSLRRPLCEDKFVVPSENETFDDALPQGFLDRIAHRGKIIGWAPQVHVLGHRAIGGFVTHCGWNSVLEAMWFGVPIAAWPMYAEQQLNAFKLVKEFELAVEIRLDYQRNLMKKDAKFNVTADEVENGVRKLMSMDEAMKGRIQEMRNKCRKVLEYGGSSHNSLTRFINEVVESVGIN